MKDILFVFSLLIASALSQRKNFWLEFAKCNDTFFPVSIYGSTGSYLTTYHGPSGVACGGDPLTRGLFQPRTRGPRNFLKVAVTGANPWNLYSIYFLPVGGDPVSDKVFVGEFMTDAAGDTGGSVWVKDCSSTFTPTCFTSTSRSGRVDMSRLGFTIPASGQFLVYSRGISKRDLDGDGIYETWKTSDNTASGTMNNPTLWGTGIGYDGVQFISAWS